MSLTEVLVCRGCCCGTVRKHPGTDHDAQLETLRGAASDDREVRVREVDCLGPCQRSNVVVLRRVGRPAREAVWLGGMVTTTQTASLASWIAAGGDLDTVPPELELLSRFEPPAPRARRNAS